MQLSKRANNNIIRYILNEEEISTYHNKSNFQYTVPQF